MRTESPVPSLETIDLSDVELFRHGFPHETFTVLREQAPVWWHPATPGIEALGGALIDEGFWVVSCHAAVETVSRDHSRFRSFEGPQVQGWKEEQRGKMLIAMDPPDHTRLRRLINSGFTPKMTARLEDRARDWAVTIAEQAVERGECEFVHEVAYQLPMHMIADIVGIPLEDREWYFDLVQKILVGSRPDTELSPEEQQALGAQMLLYGRELAARKRREPADDVWTTLTTTEVEQPDGTKTRLDEVELDLFFMTLTVAGSETTRDAIAGGLLALLEHPDQMARMRDDPSTMGTAVDEIVRWTSPVTVFTRTAVEDTVLHDVPIRAGERVSLWYPSANRDAEVFADPFRFDVMRDPNPHVGFGGHGVHYCLGANLARREIRVMFEELLARVADVELLGEPMYRPAGIRSMICYSAKEIPVRLVPR